MHGSSILKSLLRAHFRIKEFKCDKCDRLFGEIGQLNHHYSLHEGINYLCRICDLKYVASHRKTITGHLRKKHGDVVGENVNDPPVHLAPYVFVELARISGHSIWSQNIHIYFEQLFMVL